MFILASYIVVALVLAKLRVLMGGYIYIYRTCSFQRFFVFQSGAALIAICSILELKSPIYMPTWLLAFGFCWFLVFVFKWLAAIGTLKYIDYI